MMIGTRVRVRSSRQTSIPDLWGSQMSSRTTSGRTRSNMASPSIPSRATVTRKPSRFNPTTSASMKDSSSSMTSTEMVSVRVIIWDSFSGGDFVGRDFGDGNGGQVEVEDRSFALHRRDANGAPVVGRNVSDDRQPETGSARGPGAGPVDPVEPLEDSLQIAGRNTDSLVG